METNPTPYRQALLTARGMGRTDGMLAADWAIEPHPEPLPSGLARGRRPDAFARYLWVGRAGQPPAGLELNAQLSYAAGFREGLHRSRSDRPSHANQAGLPRRDSSTETHAFGSGG